MVGKIGDGNNADPGRGTSMATVKGQLNPAVNELLENANELRDEKSELFARVGANRDLLRNYKKLGLLNKEQSDAIDKFYPPQVKGGKNKATASAS